jgi:hypothetical protein
VQVGEGADTLQNFFVGERVEWRSLGHGPEANRPVLTPRGDPLSVR